MTNDSDNQKGERLQRVLASRGVASRRASEQLILDGKVQVNGKVVTELGTRVNPDHDQIRVNGNPVPQQLPRYIMLNKPTGFITTVSDEKQRWTVMDLVQVPERIYPIGRLDRDTEGLLLFTTDGDLANRIMHPSYKLDKQYLVITKRRPSDEQIQTLREGILIDDRVVVPDECRLLRETTEGIILSIVIHEGLNHVVRRMMEAVGIVISKLRRVRVGPVAITGVPSGAWRDLTNGELSQLFEAVGLSKADADKANKRRPKQLDPVGGYVHQPKVKHPKRIRQDTRMPSIHDGSGRSGSGRRPSRSTGRNR